MCQCRLTRSQGQRARKGLIEHRAAMETRISKNILGKQNTFNILLDKRKKAMGLYVQSDHDFFLSPQSLEG